MYEGPRVQRLDEKSSGSGDILFLDVLVYPETFLFLDILVYIYCVYSFFQCQTHLGIQFLTIKVIFDVQYDVSSFDN